MNHKASSHIIVLDFSKAFGSVPHGRLFLKLEHVGVRGTLLHWVRGFLNDQEQRVIADGQNNVGQGTSSIWCSPRVYPWTTVVPYLHE